MTMKPYPHQIKSIFIEKSCRKCAAKASPRPLKRRLSKSLKKGNFIFSNPVPFNGQNDQNKRGLELVTSPYSGYKTSSEKFLY